MDKSIIALFAAIAVVVAVVFFGVQSREHAFVLNVKSVEKLEKQEKYASLTGRLRTKAGGKIAHLILRCDKEREKKTQSATDGYFRFDGLRASRCSLRLSMPELSAVIAENIDIPNESEKNLGDVAIPNFLPVRGKVIDAESKNALPDVVLTGSGKVKTNAEGHFLVYVPDDQKSDLLFTLPGYKDTVLSVETNEILPFYDVCLKKKEGIRVFIKRDSDRKVTGNVIFREAESGAATTLAVGETTETLHFDAQEDTVYDVVMTLSPESMGTFPDDNLSRTALPGEVVEFRFKNFATVTVYRNLREETWQKHDPYSVVTQVSSGKVWRSRDATVAETIERLPEGEYKIEQHLQAADADEIFRIMEKKIRLDAGEEAIILFEEENASQFSGRLLSIKDKQPLADHAVIYGNPNDPETLRQVTSNKDGYFQISDLPKDRRINITVQSKDGKKQDLRNLSVGRLKTEILYVDL